MPSISAVIYGHNEEKNIRRVVEETVAVLEKIAERYEIILVNDGSTDQTNEVMQALARENLNVRLIKHRQREGIGACLKDGYREAQGELISFLPADGQISPLDLERFVREIADVDVVTSYYKTKPFPLSRKVMSKGVRFLVSLLFGYHPRIEGSYMFRKNILERISLTSSSFVINFEFIIKSYKQGYRFKEIETVSLPRLSGKSKVINFKTISKVFFEIIKLRFRSQSLS